MEKKYKRRAIDNIRFSIGKKLVIIISIMVIISLGSITALASWLIYEDLRINAEETNFEANRRSATEAETTFANVRSNSRILIQAIIPMGANNAAIKEMTDFFFTENPQVVALSFITQGKQERAPLVNDKFFLSEGIDRGLAASYFNNQRAALGRAVLGETVVLNAAPYFSRSVLALYFPWQNAGACGVLFSSETLNNSFGSGINQSFMINTQGDILLSADFELVRSAVNIANEDFIREIFDSQELSRQRIVEAEFKFLQGGRSAVNTDFFAVTWAHARPAIRFVMDKLFDNINKYLNTDLSLQQGNAGPSDRRNTVMRQFLAFTKLNNASAVVITSIEYDRVFEGIAATTRRNIYLTVTVLSLSVIFIWFFSKTISIPLKTLAVAARSIEAGEFKVELNQKSGDEIGILTSSFQRMSNALGIFGKFTNRDIAIKAMRGQIKPGGLPKHATVFFSDIRNFTSISETFTKSFGNDASDRIVFWLNNYLTQMVDCVENTNGVVDKFIGDAVMAHWGTAYTAGSPRKDAFNCVMAALMMRRALYNLNKNREKDDPANPAIRIGCGINTGIVTAGQIGSDLRMEYTVIGDPVNLASRVESLNKPLGTDILITEDTWNLVGSKFITEEMPSVTVKGKEKPVRIFAVVNHIKNSKGPFTLAEMRDLLGIEPPQMSKVDLNADEKKYKIGETA